MKKITERSRDCVMIIGAVLLLEFYYSYSGESSAGARARQKARAVRQV
jgi:hypothetical protein